jgi:hypothetical protein
MEYGHRYSAYPTQELATELDYTFIAKRTSARPKSVHHAVWRRRTHLGQGTLLSELWVRV